MIIKLEIEKDQLVPLEVALDSYLCKVRDAQRKEGGPATFVSGSCVDAVMRVLNRVTNILNGNDENYNLDHVRSGWERRDG